MAQQWPEERSSLGGERQMDPGLHTRTCTHTQSITPINQNEGMNIHIQPAKPDR